MAFEWIVRVASGPRDPNRPNRQWPTVARRFLFRTAVLGILTASLWIIGGSVMYPSWWYEFIWRGEIFDPLFISAGCTYLLENELWLTIAILIVTLALGFVISRIWPRISRILDRHGAVVILACVIGMLVNVGILYNTQRVQYQILMSLKDSVVKMLDQVGAYSDNPLNRFGIELPVNFQYLERDRITAIYSQTEAFLVEKEHSISLQDKRDTSAGLVRTPVELKTEASTAVTETSSYKSIELSPERKCLEVIKELFMRDAPPYYKTASATGLFIIACHSKEKSLLLQHEFKVRRSWYTMRLPPVTKDRLSEMQREIQNIQSALSHGDNIDQSIEAELHSLSGLVIVDGVFRKTQVDNQTANFDEQFATGSRPVWFRFKLRDKAALDMIHNGAKLRVLGNVARPWDGGRYLELYPIAVF